MKSKKLINIIGIIYLLYSIFFITINYAIIDIFDILGVFLAVSILFVLRNKKDINNKLFMVGFITLIIIRVTLIFLPYGIVENDYQFFFTNAIEYAKGLPINNNYISLFPYLYFYVTLLGFFMKLLTTSYKVVIILNLLFELLGLLLFYFLAREKYDISVAKKGALFYLLNPFSTLWITKCCPVIIVNTLLLAILYFFEKIKKNNKLNYVVLYSIILGVIMSIEDHFRPIMIIFVIALLCHLVLILIYKRNEFKKYFVSFIILIIPYLLLNIGFNNLISNRINYDLPKNSGGWSIYVGSNYKYRGRWNAEDSKYFSKILEKYDNITAQQIMQKKGINRYKKLGLKSLNLILSKSVVLGGAVPNNTFVENIQFIALKFNKIINFLLRLYIYFYLFIILLLNLIITFKVIKKRTIDFDNIIYIIFTIGLFTSMLLVEVSERYFLPILIPILVYDLKYFLNRNVKKDTNN